MMIWMIMMPSGCFLVMNNLKNHFYSSMVDVVHPLKTNLKKIVLPEIGQLMDEKILGPL